MLYEVITDSDTGHLNYTLWQPVGVCALISPFEARWRTSSLARSRKLPETSSGSESVITSYSIHYTKLYEMPQVCIPWPVRSAATSDMHWLPRWYPGDIRSTGRILWNISTRLIRH